MHENIGFTDKNKIYYKSPLGLILIESSRNGITSLVFAEKVEVEAHWGEDVPDETPSQSIEMESQVISQLEEYFKRKRQVFDLQLDLQGTDFQKRVWIELLKIPFGKTISYKELSIRLGNVKAIRAVAAANGANPVSVIVPCHRVIGTDGSLTGYAGGLWRKQWLLDFERNDLLFGIWCLVLGIYSFIISFSTTVCSKILPIG